MSILNYFVPLHPEFNYADMKVSIITVAYNSEKTLADAMTSVLRQTYKDIEYIVVDGLSKDGTVGVIKSFEPLFKGRLKWVSEKDRGIYDAMNKGVHMATGDVVGILNSDDFLTNDTVIERMVKEFPADAGAVYGDIHFVRAGNENHTVRYYSGRVFRPWLVRIGYLPPHPSLYVRRELFDKFGYYDASLRISADFELIARLGYKNRVPMKYLHIDFVTMRMGGASTRSWSNRMLGAEENMIACRNNGIRTNWALISMKYPIKYLQSVFIRH